MAALPGNFGRLWSTWSGRQEHLEAFSIGPDDDVERGAWS